MEQKKYTQAELQAFLEELERQMKNRYDIVVSGNTLSFGTENGTLRLEVPQPDNTFKFHGMTEYFQRQVARTVGMDYGYYEKCRNRKELQLLCNNVNTWLPDSEKRLVRVLDNEAIGFLGPNYRCINNYDIAAVVFNTLERMKRETGLVYNVLRVDLTESHMYIKITSPMLTDDILHFKGRGEPIQGGIVIRNTEVGDGAFVVEPFINVLVCTNGLIRTKILRKVHRGISQGLGEIDWSSEVHKKRNEVLWAELEELITKTFTVETFRNWVREINEKAQVEIPKPTLAVDNVVKHFKLPKTIINALVDQYVKEQSPTVWGLSMAVTRVAQDQKDYEKQIEMERIGSDILSMNPKILMKEIVVEE